jgi:hypothetical protein
MEVQFMLQCEVRHLRWWPMRRRSFPVTVLAGAIGVISVSGLNSRCSFSFLFETREFTLQLSIAGQGQDLSFDLGGFPLERWVLTKALGMLAECFQATFGKTFWGKSFGGELCGLRNRDLLKLVRPRGIRARLFSFSFFETKRPIKPLALTE